jgi:hypothetical protein
MKEKHELRLKIDEEIFIRYKIFCVNNRLSLSKQTGALIQNFLDMHDTRPSYIKRLP